MRGDHQLVSLRVELRADQARVLDARNRALGVGIADNAAHPLGAGRLAPLVSVQQKELVGRGAHQEHDRLLLFAIGEHPLAGSG